MTEERSKNGANRGHRGASPHPPTTARRARARVSGRTARLPGRLAPRKAPAQERSRATVEAILTAAVDLLAARGYAKATTNAIAARAGVSVGSLYQYFPNKDAILTTLFERHASGIEAIVQGTLADLRRPEVPVREVFARMLAAFEAFHEADPRLIAALAPHADGRHEFVEIMRRREERFREEMAGALGLRPDVRDGNHALMASLLFEIVEAVTKALMHGDARRHERREAFEEGLLAICRYLEAPARR